MSAEDESIDRAKGRTGAEPRQYLSARDAAQILGVNRATVINWARQGKFGGYQYGARGIYRFNRHEIEAFIEQSRLPSPDEGKSEMHARKTTGS